MLFNLFLIILFAGSIGALWYRISEKIPELVAIPDEVIVARLHEDSARVRIFLLHARTFWREPRYRESFWHFCEKICYRAHILLLRMDNGLMAVAKKVRNYGEMASAEMLDAAGHREERTTETAYASDPPVPSLPSMRISFASSFAPTPRIVPVADSHSYLASSQRSVSRVSNPRTPGARIQEVRKKRVKAPLVREPHRSS